MVISLAVQSGAFASETIESEVSFDSMFSTDGGDEEVVLSTTIDSAASGSGQPRDPTILEVEKTVVFFVSVGSGAFTNRSRLIPSLRVVAFVLYVVAFSVTVDSTMSVSEASDIDALEWSEAFFDFMSSTIKVVFEWATCTQDKYWDLNGFSADLI